MFLILIFASLCHNLCLARPTKTNETKHVTLYAGEQIVCEVVEEEKWKSGWEPRKITYDSVTSTVQCAM